MASGAEILLVSEERGERRVKIDEQFFISYRRTTIVPDEVLKGTNFYIILKLIYSQINIRDSLGIWIPLTEKNQFFRAYKQAQRREDDISIVTGAFSAKIDPESKKIIEIKAAFGGMAPVTKLALQTTKGLEGHEWNEKLLGEVVDRLVREFELPPGVSFVSLDTIIFVF
jgi:xanthine dehydrogenase/oxidase